MKILFAGTPQVAADSLSHILSSPQFAAYEVAAVLTREDAPTGRKRVLTQSPVADVAVAHDIKVIKANRIDTAALEAITAIGAEVAVVVAYGVILKPDALRAIPRGWFNLHYSLLPKYRGAAPVQRAIMAGEEVTGVTLFQLDAGMDTGPVAGMVPAEIQPNDTAGTLLTRLRILGLSLLSEKLPAIAAGLCVFEPQEDSQASFAAKLTRADAQLDFGRSATELQHQIAGCNPEPMAFATLRGESFRVLDARVQDSDTLTAEIGTVQVQNNKVVVTCGAGSLELITVQPAGKKPMSATDWARGQQLPMRFESQHA